MIGGQNIASYHDRMLLLGMTNSTGGEGVIKYVISGKTLF
jgi:hypothetical protein